ncbi:MAG: hypothetical protein HY329_24240 [Chloroflexi bacterium]|nr:hypothetical protein [Chloroflexota bacterium]
MMRDPFGGRSLAGSGRGPRNGLANTRRPQPPVKVTGWTVAKFLDEVVERTRGFLPPERRDFADVRHWGLLKLSYGDPQIHYEVGVRKRTGRVEVGLHFEADHATNAALLQHFDDHVIPIKATLGERFEVEAWDRGWARIYTLVPVTRLDDDLADRTAELLSDAIDFLQPILEEVGGEPKP